MITKQQIESLKCVQLAVMYMCRPNCHMLGQKLPEEGGSEKRWESHINFIGRIFTNLREAGLDEDGEFYLRVCARVCIACRSNLERRLELLGPVLDALDCLLDESNHSK